MPSRAASTICKLIYMIGVSNLCLSFSTAWALSLNPTRPESAENLPAPLKNLKLYKLCRDVFSESFNIELNTNEKILICGTERSDGYENIPHLQKIQSLKVILQNRGFAFAEFEIKDEYLIVRRGSVAKVNALRFEGTPNNFHAEYKRKVVGETMNSSKLDEVEGWSKARLGHTGYPCHSVQLQAELPNRDLNVKLNSGPFQKFSSVDREGLDILDEQAVLRQEAFKLGWDYDAELVELSNQRLLRDGLVQSSYYSITCSEEGAKLIHHISIGQPRLLRVGLGASTEELPFLDILWKNQRLDPYGSQLGLSAHASNRIQNAQFFSEFFIFKKARDVSINPRFEVERRSEVAFEILTAKTGGDLSYRKEFKPFRAIVSSGPTVNYQNTVRGEGPTESKYLTVQGQLNLFTHSFEFYQVQQITGTNLSFQFLTQRKGVGSEINATHFLLKGKTLFNFKHYSPALWVNGFRWQVATTLSDELRGTQNQGTSLPLEYRTYLGGVDSLRGFGRLSLNNSNLGYLSVFYIGYETRLVETLPFQIQPLLLFDYAKLGVRTLTLDPETFISYGGGVRWMSPFGPLRLVMAKGEVLNAQADRESTPKQWAFTASFGQEF